MYPIAAGTSDLRSLRQRVLNYCSEGNQKALADFFAELDKDLCKELVQNHFSDGQTSLIASCRNGHRDLVNYLIDVWHVDIEQVNIHNYFYHLI
ncbi:unnamed protein product [Protopolystoma xenopodis]|uniref:ANK_REP_REGION domain-containing protein n=1 Tax=Protopolystoma xenopodis TaxID=117903 RepID=A0A3S5A971_9PLAT|nr:unnamed protein product [Protopolystoma xenopodis]